MKSVNIIGLKKDRKTVLEHLQDSGLIQIKKNDKSAKGFSKTDMSSQMQIFEKNVTLTEQALKAMESFAPEKKGMLSSFEGRREIDPDEIGAIASGAGEIIEICNKINNLNKQLADNSAEQVRIKTALVQLEPWQNLDIPLNTGDTKTTAVFIGTLPKQYDEITLSQELAQENPQLVFDFEIQFQSRDMTCMVMFTPLAQKAMAEEVLRNLGFAKPMSPTSHTPKEKSQRLKNKSQELFKKSEEAKAQIISYADRREDIKNTQDYFRIRADKYNVISQLDQTKHVFVISGYIPEEDCKDLEEMCERIACCYVEFGEVDPKDAPVKLKNNRFAEPAQGIVSMYSTPSHADVDPTPILAFFFYFFFGMMFSDAGYGLVMVVAIAIVLKIFKPDKKMRNNLKLFQYCGVSTIIWGLIFGSIFGDAPATFYNVFTGADITMKQLLPWPTLDPQKDALLLMVVSIAFGLVHILIGMGCKFYICFKQKDYKAAFFDTGLWMLMLIGFAVLAVGMITNELVMFIGAGIAIACAIGLVLTQGRNKKGIVGKAIGGLASLYDITSYISDLLSYSRLLALGLTTGVMAQVFNMLATMLGTSIPGIIFMIVIFIVGHLVTIGLNALGSYVHTMRLQYVEMFSKFYEGGGKPFEPFSLNSKYFKTKNNKDN
ncbi:MAG: V-type ATP synthase subunit I [Oscillospiraceae bacterium]|nr:V-type ATP synthase subunit I [Oscillospiraceae bacterium]